MAKARDPHPDEAGAILYPLGIAVLVVGIVFGFALLPRVFQPRQNALVGSAAPAFTLDLLANGDSLAGSAPGKRELSLADLKGKAVILDFWATWCGPCQAEAPILDRLARRYRDRGLVVLGVDTNDRSEDAERWARAHGLDYPILADDQRTSAAYGVESLPTLVLLSREGKVVAVRIGVTDSTELESLLKQVL